MELSYIGPIEYPYQFSLRVCTSEINFVLILQDELFCLGFTVYQGVNLAKDTCIGMVCVYMLYSGSVYHSNAFII